MNHCEPRFLWNHGGNSCQECEAFRGANVASSRHRWICLTAPNRRPFFCVAPATAPLFHSWNRFLTTQRGVLSIGWVAGAGQRFQLSIDFEPGGRSSYCRRPFNSLAHMGPLQAPSVCRVRQSRRRIVMKSQRPTHVKNAQKLSDAIIAKRYLDLQRLREEVKKIEQSCGMLVQKVKGVRRCK
jgi:hypothetical protein